MVVDYFDKLTFLCEMYDRNSDRFVELVLNYFPFDNSCQVLNVKKGTTLVRRVHLPTLKLEMLQVGNTIKVFSKLLLIKDCATATKKKIFDKFESTFGMIKPVPPELHGKIFQFITAKGFRIVRMKNGKLNKEFAMALYENIGGSDILPVVINYITGGEVIGLELVGPNAVIEWRRCLGTTDPEKCYPGTLRSMFGKNMLENVAHGCRTRQKADQMLEMFFGHSKDKISNFPFRATFKDCTCCVIKPHAVIDGKTGHILDCITSSKKFVITAMAMFSVALPDAEEFYEVYKDVVPEYKASCVQLAEGKCVALEVKCTDPSLNSVSEFRKLCGPRDPDLCRQLYPDTIRALYGKNIVENAVHCTDLPEDGVNEVEYFFKLLAYQ
ncbi:hypothetical protein PYW07_010041 [Mythimna separata]|uniref:DM10 domain-containing protein n=1 Tax=Mythimna separata TaxID=271217 RepID=A0AAD7YID5_MYTSE|nr:hypothetical protein PYW07_010041 [Mythimna separata]